MFEKQPAIPLEEFVISEQKVQSSSSPEVP